MCKKCKQGEHILDQNPEAVELAKERTVRHTHWPRPRRVIAETHYYRTPDFGADGDTPWSQVKRKQRDK